MAEAQENAKVLQHWYANWLGIIGLKSRLCLAREYVRTQLGEESETVIDNVAQALHEGATK
jgi:hypothetical protein